ncbi:MAG: hypothetical protein OQK78_04075 [Gammaproteobacteria bacterium]|nr:hypothetical protein [Gammaproteobacteria bacterium]
MKKYLGLVISAVTISVYLSTASAVTYWPPTLTDWSLSLNNGVAYITSSQFASHCSHNRGQIKMDGTEFNKAQYAYAMSAKARGKKMAYVVDDVQTTCVIYGLQEVD